MDKDYTNDMLPYEKERIFSEEIENLITRFTSEYHMTYAQIIGCLSIAQSAVTLEGFKPNDET